MDYQKFMIDSLTPLLEDGETLVAPVYGIMNRANEQYFGYFAIAGDCLLIALVEGYTVVATSRMPLELSSFKMKRSLILRQYIFNLRFANGQSIKLTLSPRVFAIASQKENAPHFAEILSSVSLTADAGVGIAVSGKKIRRQYFNMLIYMVFYTVFVFVVALAIRSALAGDEFAKTIFVGLSVEVVLLSPVILLSIFNRFFFGKTVAVANEDGLFIDGLMIPWRDISGVVYCPRISSRTRIKKCYAEIHMHKEAGGNIVELMSCPLYALRLMRKFNPEIKTKFDRTGKLIIASYTLGALLLSLVFLLI